MKELRFRFIGQGQADQNVKAGNNEIGLETANGWNVLLVEDNTIIGVHPLHVQNLDEELKKVALAEAKDIFNLED